MSQCSDTLPAEAKASISSETRHRLDSAFPMFGAAGLATFGRHRYVATSDASSMLRQYRHTPVDMGDVWVMSLPKCGTTWMQELVWLVSHDCDFKSAQCLLCPDRYQFLELPAITIPSIRQAILDGRNQVSKRQMQSITTRAKPWFVKTHLPLYMCPDRLLDSAKVIYVARNPKDMCVSYYNHLKLFEERDPDLAFDDFVDLFIRGEVMCLPYFPHVLEAWQQRHHKNLLFMFFEDMKRDLRSSILKVGNFLEKSLSELQLDQLERHLSFDVMKDNPWSNKSALYAYSPLLPEEIEASSSFLTQHTADAASQSISVDGTNQRSQFMRKGRVGDWVNYFSEATSQKMDKWIHSNLQHTDLKFSMKESSD